MTPGKIPGFPPDIAVLGEYEAMLLGKLLKPHSPVLCVEGPMGSGKTTTLNYLVSIFNRIDCTICSSAEAICPRQRLLATIDFRQLVHARPDADDNIEELVREICRELYARCREFIGNNEEFGAFWNDLIERYKGHDDPEIGPVARRLLDERPDLYDPDEEEVSSPELVRRESLLNDLRSKDPRWHLKYLVLLWRHMIKVFYAERRECALVVLDNLDSLAPYLQRLVLDFVMRSAHQEGPTFVVAVRPETRMRQGLADVLVDVVIQEGPRPVDVVLDRLSRFKHSPDRFYDPELGLAEDQFALVKEFVSRVFSELRTDDSTFFDFISNACGRNIRLALLLAQGLFFVSMADMSNPAVTQHFLVRSCVRQGQLQFHGGIKSPIASLFHTDGVVESARLLLKPRILRFVDSQSGRCAVGMLRTAFVHFGYEEEWIKMALNELLRHECQLLRSDGFDVFREHWGDEQETLYLSAIGEGYIGRFIHDTDYVQEVMLDSRIDESGWPREVPYGYLSEKLKLLRRFLRELYRADREEVEGFLMRLGVSKYAELFGANLITLGIIQHVYQSVGRIIYYTVGKNPHQRDMYNEVLADYTSLVREVEYKNEKLFGVETESVEEYAIRRS